MAEKTAQDLLADPRFYDVAPEKQKYLMGQYDEKFKNSPQAVQDEFLKSQTKRYQDGLKQAGKVQQESAQAGQEHQSWFNQNIAQPLNNIVGRGMEALASPAVPIARLAQGEGMRSFVGNEETLGAGGAAKRTREKAASGVVPQEPWQAALMAAPVVGKAIGAAAPAIGADLQAMNAGGRAARVGLSGLLAGAGEAAMGDQSQTVGQRAGAGALKGMLGQAVPETVAGLSGMASRVPLFGGTQRVAEEQARKAGQTVGEIAPEMAGKRNSAQLGQFFQEGGAKAATQNAFESKMTELDNLVKSGAEPYIKSQELQDVYRKLAKFYKNKPGFSDQLIDLAPGTQGFMPSQAAKLLGRYREMLQVGNDKMSGHMAQEAIDAILADAAQGSSSNIAKAMLDARQSFARGSALQDVMEKAFPENAVGAKGYRLDQRALQRASRDPEVLRRLTPEEAAKLKDLAVRGSKVPGAVDRYPGESQYLPYPSKPGVMIYALRKLVHGNKYVGEKPLTATGAQAAKAGQKVGQLLGPAIKNYRDLNEE